MSLQLARTQERLFQVHSGEGTFYLSLSVALVTPIIVILSVKFWSYLRRRQKFVEAVEKLPGPSLEGAHPWLAHLHDIILTMGGIPGKPQLPRTVDVLRKWGRSHVDEGIFRIWAFNPYRLLFARGAIFVFDPVLMKNLLTNKAITSRLIKEKRIYDLSAPVLGDSFLSMRDGPEWKLHRKIATRGFHHGSLEYANETIVQLLQTKAFPKWDAAISSSSNNDRTATTVEMVEWATRMTLEVLGEVAFSHSFGGLDDNHNSQEESLYETYRFMLAVITKFSRLPPLVSWLWIRDRIKLRKCQNRVDTVIHRIVRERLDEEESNTKTTSRSDLLSHLLSKDEDGYRLPYKYLFGNTRMFLFAGHDTTAASLSGTFWQLARNPRVQEKLQHEIDALFEKSNQVDYKQIMQLCYLDAVIKEALRLHAPAGVGRTVLQDVTVENAKGRAFTIPAGATFFNFAIVASTYDELYPNATEFRPERYLEDPDAMLNWYPFSYGPRNCVGQPLAIAELKIIVVHVLRRYNLRVNALAQEPIPTITITAKPHQVLLDLEQR